MRFRHLILSRMPLFMQRLIRLRNLNGWKELYQDCYADSLVKSKKVKCDSHLFFIAGLPKSGTTWLEQLLAHTPGLVQLNKSSLRSFPHYLKSAHEHNLDPRMITCAPLNRLSYLKLHLNPYPRNLEILDQHSIKTTVLIRDLRDMLISRYHHIIKLPHHWDYDRLQGIDEKKRLLESMKGIGSNGLSVIEYYTSWISGWLERVEKEPDKTMLIKYEKMKSDLPAVLARLFAFYGYRISPAEINGIIARHGQIHARERERGLSDNLRNRGRMTSTFRKGETGEWRDVFDEKIKDFIKEHAGSALIKAGYEKGLDW